MTSTGLTRLDRFLGGSVPDGILIDILGPSGTGKTLLALQVALDAARTGPVLMHDTTGSFRPERLHQLACRRHGTVSLLDRISVYRITNISEQLAAISAVGLGQYSCIIIDTISDPFHFEYHDYRHAKQKNRRFLRYMRAVSFAAAQAHTSILFTNTIRNQGSMQVESLGGTVDLFAHVKISLGAGDPATCVCTSALAESKFAYVIEPDGIREAVPG